jgi:hypothetical protein
MRYKMEKEKRMKGLVPGLVFMIIFSLCAVLLLPGQKKESHNQPFENIQITGKQAGYILLNSVVVTFAELSKTGKGEEETIVRELNTWMIQARFAKDQNLIDDVFFKRYKRILAVIRLTIIKAANHAFDHLIVQEINKFDIPQKMKGGVYGLASVAGALAKEIQSLKGYLDKKNAFQAAAATGPLPISYSLFY